MIAEKTRTGKSPEQMRYERAVAEYDDYAFRGPMQVRTSAGPRGLVYVTSKSGNTYCVTDTGRCDCPDYQRRNNPYGNSPCKHVLAVGIFLTCGTADPQPEEPEADPGCPACHGTGTVTDWVDYGSTKAALETDCDCVGETAEEKKARVLAERALWD